MTRLPGLRRPRFLDPWRRPLAPRLPWHVVLAASIAGALTIATLSLGEDLASAPLLVGAAAVTPPTGTATPTTVPIDISTAPTVTATAVPTRGAPTATAPPPTVSSAIGTAP